MINAGHPLRCVSPSGVIPVRSRTPHEAYPCCPATLPDDMFDLMNHWLRAPAPFGLRLESAMMCLVSCVALSTAPARAAEGSSLEYAVKAAYLYKFGLYVDWPASAFASPESAIHLCIFGEDPFGNTIDEAVKGQLINRRPIVIRRLKAGSQESGCHIMYLGTSDIVRAAQHPKPMIGKGVLTVSDVPGIGIINFVIKDNRVRFDIDEEAAAQNGLGISSKLLDLALTVKPRQGANRSAQ